MLFSRQVHKALLSLRMSVVSIFLKVSRRAQTASAIDRSVCFVPL